MKVTVRDRQSVFDLALRWCGDAEVAFAIAELNDMSVSEQIDPDTEIEVPSVMERRVVEYYKQNSIEPATMVEDTNYLITYKEELIITNNNENMVENG
ncbi:MAG: hypothetical protein IJU33_00150 [Bacteroidales bacterium]|nr:hypothetical protein [Bacteroidales bacterium]